MRARSVLPVLVLLLVASLATAAWAKPVNGGGASRAEAEVLDAAGNATLVVVLNSTGGDGVFGFEADADGLPESFSLATASGAASTTFSGLDAGDDARLSLDALAGWRATAARCSAGEPDEIVLAEDATTTCWFDVERLGTLTIHVNASGNATFAFDATGAGLPDDVEVRVVNGTGSASFDTIVPESAHTIDAAANVGWTLVADACTEAIVLAPGGAAHCWFAFAATPRDAELHAKVVALGGDDTFTLRFSADDTTTAHRLTTEDGLAWKNFTGLDAERTYGLRLVVDDDWRVSRSACGSVDLDPGQTLLCSFVVTKLGEAQGRVTNASTGAGIAGVTVYADVDGDGDRDAREPADATDATGHYVLDGLPLGDGLDLRVDLDGSPCTVASPSDGERTIDVTAGSVDTAENFRLSCPAPAVDGGDDDENDDDGSREGAPGGGPGYWKNWENHHDAARVTAWVDAVHDQRDWSMPAGYAATAEGLRALIVDSEGQCMRELGAESCGALREAVRELVARLNALVA